MNTPLTLRKCPFCAQDPITGIGNKVVKCVTPHCPASLAFVAIAAWNTRANTPESSAAQGAMGDERNYIVKNEGQFATCAGMPPHDFEDKDGYPLWRHNTIKQHFAQPSDATAQPSADASTPEAKGNISAWLRRRAHNDLVMIPGSLAAQIADHIDALANTAQGKPEQEAAINLALEWDKSRKYIMPYIIRDALRAALAAKKG